MRRYSIIGLMFLTLVLAMSCVVAGSASAAVECVKVPPGYNSKWKTSSCTGEEQPTSGYVRANIPGTRLPPYYLCVQVVAGEPSNFQQANCTGAMNPSGYTVTEWTEGPGIDTGEARLEEGETRELVGTKGSGENFKLEAKASGATPIVCKALKLKAGATLDGSTGGNASTIKATLEYSKCEGGAKSGGTKCSPEGEKVTSNALVGTLGFANESRTGLILVLFAPASGKAFASVKFSGTECFASSATVEGQTIGEAYTSGKLVEVGANEVEALKDEIRFPATKKKIYTESAGELKAKETELTLYGESATLEGSIAFGLSNGKAWGVFT